MIQDLTTLLSAAQAITATGFSTNILDLGATGTVPGYAAPIVRDIGKGVTVPLATRIVEAFNNLTSLTIAIEVASDAGFTSPVTIWQSPAYPLADLAVGARFVLPDAIPVGANQRYLRLKYSVAGAAPTTGRITAGVTTANQTNGAL